MSGFFGAIGDLLSDPLMQRALVAAFLVGISAPVIGTYLVQRRLALLGDGIGHVALTGVALGWLVGSMFSLVPQDVLAVPGAIVTAIGGAILIEVLSSRGKMNGDVALALLFYGGIASGVLVISLAGGTNAKLVGYLFGSISTVSTGDLALTVGLTVLILAVGFGLQAALFAICHDEEFARASGLPVRMLNIVLAVTAALTVTVSMRVVGLLLVSALMIVPVAIAQLWTRSFKRTMVVAMVTGMAVCVVGLSITYFVDIPPGATIVVLAIATYAASAIVRPFVRKRSADAESAPSADDLELVGAHGPGEHA